MGIRGGMNLWTRISPILNPVSWQKSGLAIRRYHRPSSPAQMEAQRRFASAAAGARGRRGKVNGLPVTAAVVRASLGGRSLPRGRASEMELPFPR